MFRPLLGGILALAAAMGIGRFAYTPILPAMEHMASLGTVPAGLIASANYVGYLLGALLLALHMVESFRARVLAACLIAIALTTALMAATTDVVAWGIIRFLVGLASAGAFVLISAIILDLLQRRGSTHLSGWLYGGIGLGIAVTGVVVRLVDRALGWRGDWLVLAVLAAIFVAIAWPWLPLKRDERSATLDGRSGDQSSDRGALALLAVAYFLEGLGYSATATFLVAIVDKLPGMATVGPSIWIIVGLAAAPSCILWSRLAARVGYAPALALAYLVQAFATVLPAVSGRELSTLAAAVLFGGTFLGIVTLSITLGGQLAPGRAADVVAILTVAFGLGQIGGPAGAGLLAAQAGSFGPALLAAAASVLLGGVLVAALPLRGARLAHHR